MNKAILFLIPLVLCACEDAELIKIKNKEIDALKTQKIALTEEGKVMKESLKGCQKQNQENQTKIEELNKALEQTNKIEQILPEKKEAQEEINQKPEGKTP
jgi:hypothetical protein